MPRYLKQYLKNLKRSRQNVTCITKSFSTCEFKLSKEKTYSKKLIISQVLQVYLVVSKLHNKISIKWRLSQNLRLSSYKTKSQMAHLKTSWSSTSAISNLDYSNSTRPTSATQLFLLKSITRETLALLTILLPRSPTTIKSLLLNISSQGHARISNQTLSFARSSMTFLTWRSSRTMQGTLLQAWIPILRASEPPSGHLWLNQ